MSAQTPLLDAIGSLKRRIIAATADIPTEVWMSESTRIQCAAEFMLINPEESYRDFSHLISIDGLKIRINNTFSLGVFALSSNKPESTAVH